MTVRATPSTTWTHVRRSEVKRSKGRQRSCTGERAQGAEGRGGSQGERPAGQHQLEGGGAPTPRRGGGRGSTLCSGGRGRGLRLSHYSKDVDKSRGRGGPPPTPGGREAQRSRATLQSSSALGSKAKRIEQPGGLPSKLIYSRNMCGVWSLKPLINYVCCQHFL